MHPQVIGRALRVLLLERLIAFARSLGSEVVGRGDLAAALRQKVGPVRFHEGSTTSEG